MLHRRSFLFQSAAGISGLLYPSTVFSLPQVSEPSNYHPILHALDLSILAYHMYGQSLLWPFDPYYEEVNTSESQRRKLMKQVWSWVDESPNNPSELMSYGGYRGPGGLAGFSSNYRHDPILYRYDRLNPSKPCLNFLGERWVIYESPPELIHSIRDVFVSFQTSQKSTRVQNIEHVATVHEHGQDILYCFEGGTGDKGEPNQPHSQSLMGVVLVSQKTQKTQETEGNDRYSVHIAFRGSRSGKGSRSMRQAYSDHNARGNPDWITDLGTNLLTSGEIHDMVTQIGGVSRGFSHSLHSILPNLYACLEHIASKYGGISPEQITVTGHSLGGGLAQLFVSSLLMGSVYGPKGQGPQMPSSLCDWPWSSIKLITFGAPRIGDEMWAKELTTRHLETDFFGARFKSTDDHALSVDHPEILQRLQHQDRPAGYRVLISTDPITTDKIAGGKHVGKTIYLNDDAGTFRSKRKIPSFDTHELVNIRKQMVSQLPEHSVLWTTQTWRYATMEDMHPHRNQHQKGSVEEYQKMFDVILEFYRVNNIEFNEKTFQSDFDLFLQLLKSTT